MGYLNNSSITVDAILTRRGRELLAKGVGLNISQFALADDEIDYSLWNSDHPLGSAYYGIVIENMPITEAVPDETQNMKYKLVTLPKKTQRIPVINVPQSAITLKAGESTIVTPQTINYPSGNSTYGYTFILADSDVCDIYVAQNPKIKSQGYRAPVTENEDAQPITISSAQAVTVTAKTQVLANKQTTLTIIGNETGGRTTVTITVEKVKTTQLINNITI